MQRGMQEYKDYGQRKTQIYVMTHKPFHKPDDALYVPVHVGRCAWRKEHPTEDSVLLSYVGDDSGEHISDQNCYYSELTGMYWAWKNAQVDTIGICHYRRYLLDHDGALFTEQRIDRVLQTYDIITTKNLQLNYPYGEGFVHHHKKIYLDMVAEVLLELAPEYAGTFQQLVKEKHTYFGNMLITRKPLYDAYMEWLFNILFAVQQRVEIDEEDSYHQRIFGFLSEFLQYVWIRHNHLKVYECMVGMLGEKAEVTEVKAKLEAYFKAKDIDGAKQFFLDARRARPDLMMEASDISGELHMCMEIIAIAGLEKEKYETNLFDRISDFRELMRWGNQLNRYAMACIRGEREPDLEKWADQESLSDVAKEAAIAVMKAAQTTENG